MSTYFSFKLQPLVVVYVAALPAQLKLWRSDSDVVDSLQVAVSYFFSGRAATHTRATAPGAIGLSGTIASSSKPFEVGGTPLHQTGAPTRTGAPSSRAVTQWDRLQHHCTAVASASPSRAAARGWSKKQVMCNHCSGPNTIRLKSFKSHMDVVHGDVDLGPDPPRSAKFADRDSKKAAAEAANQDWTRGSKNDLMTKMQSFRLVYFTVLPLSLLFSAYVRTTSAYVKGHCMLVVFRLIAACPRSSS